MSGIETTGLIKFIIAVGTAWGATLSPYVIPAVGAFFMNYSVQSNIRKEALKHNTPYHRQTALDLLMVVGFGAFIGVMIVEIGSKFGITEDIKNPIAGLLGAVSPHIIAMMSDKEYMQGVLRNFIPKGKE